MPIDPPLPLRPELDIDRDRPYNDIARYLNSLAAESSGAIVNTKVYGPYTINYNTANLYTTGAVLGFTPPAGSVIMEFWWQLQNNWDGGGIAISDVSLTTAGTDADLFPGSSGPDFGSMLQNSSAIEGVDDISQSTASDARSYSGLRGGTRPVGVVAADLALKVKLTITGGPATQGRVDFYFLIAEVET